MMKVLLSCDQDADVVFIDTGYDPTDVGYHDKVGEVYEIKKSTCFEKPLLVMRGE
nr:MAG TPA: hypothetical protein [Caudoviricetes sp.]